MTRRADHAGTSALPLRPNPNSWPFPRDEFVTAAEIVEEVDSR